MRVATFLLTLLILSSCEKTTAPQESIRPVKVAEVRLYTESENHLVFPGTLRAYDRADLSFRVDGTVMTRDIYVGQTVKVDDILIQLDPRDYEVALQKAKGKLESFQAQLDFAARDFIRMKNIYDRDPGAISLSYLDRKKESENQLRADLSVARSDVDKAEDDLSYTTLKAPFDGIISAIYVERHEQVHMKQPVVRIIDTTEREMEISVPERHITTFLEGGRNLNVSVYLDAIPNGVIPAKVKEVGTEASRTTQTYPVTLILQNIPPDLVLLSGMSGTATVENPKMPLSKTSLIVPKAALSSVDSTHHFVWVVDPALQTVHKKEVILEKNSLSNDFVIVESGLNVNDLVVIAGTSFLSEGQKVKPIQDSEK